MSVHDHLRIYIKKIMTNKFFLLAAAVILFLKDPFQKLIRSLKIPGK